MSAVLDSPAPVAFDLRNPAYHADPHAFAPHLHATGPVHRDTHGIWLVTGHAESRALLTSRHLGRDPRRWARYAEIRPYMADSVLERTVERWMIFNDAPTHTRLRALAGAAFTPGALRDLRAAIEATARDLVAALPEAGEFDLMRDFAQPFPVRVIGDLLGLPPGDFARGKAWSDALALVVEPVATRALREASDRAAADMLDYLRGELARRRARGGDDLIGRMMAAQAADGSTSDDELLANLVLMFVAGHETTTNLIGNGMLTLLRHPAELARLRADPALLPGAVEEMLRFESPVNVVARIAHEDTVVANARLRAGDMLYCMVGTANRDPRVFERPGTFDVARTTNPHLSFGGGAHYCIGAPLARMEGEIAFATLLHRFPQLRLAGEAVRWRPLLNLRGLAELRLAAR